MVTHKKARLDDRKDIAVDLKRNFRLNVLTGTRFFEKIGPAQVFERLLRETTSTANLLYQAKGPHLLTNGNDGADTQ